MPAVIIPPSPCCWPRDVGAVCVPVGFSLPPVSKPESRASSSSLLPSLVPLSVTGALPVVPDEPLPLLEELPADDGRL
jgi:hypothetical protein